MQSATMGRERAVIFSNKASARLRLVVPVLAVVGLLLLPGGFAQNGNVTTNGGNGTDGSETNGSSMSSSPPAGSSPPPSESCMSIGEALMTYDFLSTLRSALDAAGMTSALDDPELAITLLAPTNS
eukprot:scaffold682396_cov37-Prasinocladus_malaysianus.AAC.1